MNYYWFNRQEILQKAKEKYSKEKAAEYYAQHKEAIKEKSRERYENLSQEEKNKIKEKYEQIWDVITNKLGIKFHSEPIYEKKKLES